MGTERISGRRSHPYIRLDCRQQPCALKVELSKALREVGPVLPNGRFGAMNYVLAGLERRGYIERHTGASAAARVLASTGCPGAHWTSCAWQSAQLNSHRLRPRLLDRLRPRALLCI